MVNAAAVGTMAVTTTALENDSGAAGGVTGGHVNKADLTFDWRDIRHLGDLATSQGRYVDTSDIYNLLLPPKHDDNQPSPRCPHRHKSDMGDVLHAYCASFIERELPHNA